MPNTPEIIIAIVDKSKFRRLLRNVFVTLALALGPIALGNYLGSVGMQWVGFSFCLILLLAFAKFDNDKHRVTSYADAHALLNRMERGEA